MEARKKTTVQAADQQTQLRGITESKQPRGRKLNRNTFTSEQLALIDAAKSPIERNRILSQIRMQRKRRKTEKKSFSVEIDQRHVDFIEDYAAKNKISNATAMEQMCDSLERGFSYFPAMLRSFMRDLLESGPYSFAEDLRDVSNKVNGMDWMLKSMMQDRPYFAAALADIQQKYNSAYDFLWCRLDSEKPIESKEQIGAWLAENLPEYEP